MIQLTFKRTRVDSTAVYIGDIFIVQGTPHEIIKYWNVLGARGSYTYSISSINVIDQSKISFNQNDIIQDGTFRYVRKVCFI